MVSGPELSRMVEEFESSVNIPNNNTKHHEQTPLIQNKFFQDVRKLVSGFEESGNPFLDEGSDVTDMHTKDVMDMTVIKSVGDAKHIGGTQFQSFIKSNSSSGTSLSQSHEKRTIFTSSQKKKVISKENRR